jgi:acetyl esterase/lipase
MNTLLRFLIAGLAFPATHGIAGSDSATAPIVVPVWPEQPPGVVCAEVESDLPARSDNVQRITHVSHPTVTIFPAQGTTRPVAAILICPGGAYNYVVMNKEGSEIAAWLNSLGITGIVLKYRVPGNKAGALQDAQRALALIRSRASEWGIDPHRLGVMGFSAGGHLAASVAASAGEKSYPVVDEVDLQSSKADFAVLIYPAFLTDKNGVLAEQFSAPASFPPTFIAVTQDDLGCRPGCLALYDVLSTAGVQADLHSFAQGGHAWGLRQKSLPVKVWPELCAAWLATLKHPAVP